MLPFIAYNDLQEQKIKNEYVLIVFLAAVLKAFRLGLTWLPEMLAGIFIVSVPMLFMDIIRPGAFGGGDIKLMAAGGCYLGMERIINAFAVSVALAGIYCIYVLVVKERGRKTRFPLGPFLCIGMLMAGNTP